MKLPQLSLRDLFWLVLVAAMGCAWWLTFRSAREAIVEAERMRTICDALQERLQEVEAEQQSVDGSDYSGVVVEIITSDPDRR